MQDSASNQINLFLNAVPRPGDTLPTSELVMTINKARIAEAGNALNEAVRLLTSVCKEFRDLGVGEIADAQELRKVVAMLDEAAVRRYVAERTVAGAGTITLGVLTLSPEKVAGLLAVSEVQDLIRANKAAQAFFNRATNWHISQFQLENGVVSAPVDAQKAVLASCMALTSDERAKKVFKIAKTAEKALRDLAALFPDCDRSSTPFLRSLDEYMAVDHETGELVVNGWFIKSFTEPQQYI